ncbi:1-acyl-sn-glycerol-3-phosphate acyltransferase [Stappia taiwanensis]|uniref:1-acyl-sn-glycerol-3-phosphate acyltransferase n=1 Tax=Stappia taiwanensis TaxID=992267 RepID=A0A838XK46_9HYPH|nr:lysophospholipid acyltransferase family protein [Stappia taiwanensis]MBA4610472.1 1-acyl-sn-glycerol-3-phosphate acyltransferase [Stappia taiwanensis]GGE84670.1 1-acyl-sn-glycerol-3-phosphate acyltransferase [Stappia taiwanensis]
MTRCLQYLFFLAVRLAVTLLLGLNIRRRELLPKDGPAIIVANHNSHLDTLVLMCLMPLSKIARVRPVAAADYFMRTRWLAWFSTRILGIIPIDRSGAARSRDPLAPCHEALERGEILILFPEGTRGQPEEMATLKKGVAFLAAKAPEVPVVPVFTHGLGKALPKGSFLLVPFFCDIFVGAPIHWPGSRPDFMTQLNAAFETLSREKTFAPWE